MPNSATNEPYSRMELLAKLAKMDPKQRDRLMKLEALRRGLPTGQGIAPAKSVVTVAGLNPSEAESLRDEMRRSSAWVLEELKKG